MRHSTSLFRRLMHSQRGATAVEYGFILAMVVLAMFVALQATAKGTIGMWNNISNQVLAAH